jgi:hypothetical protein
MPAAQADPSYLYRCQAAVHHATGAVVVSVCQGTTLFKLQLCARLTLDQPLPVQTSLVLLWYSAT